MHLAYVDDSGDSKYGVTLTALIVEDQHWSGLLEVWLTGRHDLHTEFRIPKNHELHATKLYKNGGGPRAAAGRPMHSSRPGPRTSSCPTARSIRTGSPAPAAPPTKTPTAIPTTRRSRA